MRRGWAIAAAILIVLVTVGIAIGAYNAGVDDYVFVLVPGGRQIDWPRLRAHLAVSRLALPDAEEAKTATGYERGTITPFGSSNSWPVIADTRIPGLERVAIGAGGHGVNLHVAGRDLVTALGAEVADVTRDGSG